jgi:hypothetical protein
MNVITDTLRGLVQRKLWPVAVLLLGALVAVPVLLAKEPVTAPPAPVPAVKGEGMPATFVSVAEDSGERRRVLGEEKDPFEPAPLPKAKKKKSDKSEDAEKAPKTEGEPAAGGGDASGGAPSIVPPVSAPPKKTYPLYSVKVRFGKVDGTLSTKTVERLKVLPSASKPLLVYRGVEEGGEVAVFELTGSVVALGDGKCEPSPEDCQILKLRAGETEFITVSDTGTETDDQYQLEVEKIYSKPTTSEAKVAKASPAGRELLKALDRRARYAFDAETGTLRKLDAKSAKKLTLSARRASL